MKKFTKLMLVGLICLAGFVGYFATSQVVNKGMAADLPEGTTLDQAYDEISVSDLTIDGLTNQSMVNQNKNQTVTYTKTNANGSLVFKFKYDVVNDSSSESNAFRVHFDVSDKDDNEDNCLWIRGDGTFLVRDSWHKTDAFAKGIHDVEFGRIAILKDSEPTGKYYVYYKLDGVEKDSAIKEFDVSKMDGKMYFNFNKNNLYNHVYDADLSYESAQYISVSDITNGTTIPDMGENYMYSLANAPANKSVVFVANVDYRTAENSQIYIYGDDKANWNGAGYIWFQTNKVVFGITDQEGVVCGDKGIEYTPLEAGTQHNIEYGRLAIMNGDTFTGRYHVYFKLDGVKVYGFDQAIESQVAGGGRMHFTGDSGFDYVDAYTQETPKEISVSDLTYGGKLVGESVVMNAQHEHFYDNTNHTANYSIRFKFKYEVKAGEEHQFHLSNENWEAPGTFIIKGTSIHLGKEGGGYSNITKTLSEGMHDVEYGRLANILNGQFVGTYKVYLKIDDEVIDTYSQKLPKEILESNKIFITGSAGEVNTIYDNFGKTEYETADQISIGDLKIGDNFVGEVIAPKEGTNYTYTATAAHKSVVLKFKYETAKDAIDWHQYHFNDGYLSEENGGCFWIRDDQFFISEPKTTEHVTYVHESSPITAAGTYEIEIGKLFITAGKNTGKYYLYVKVDNEMVVDYIIPSMPDKANLFITAGETDTDRLLDVGYEPVEYTYEEAQVVSLSDLTPKSNGVLLLGDESYKYTLTQPYKSVSLQFKWQLNDIESSASNIRFHNYVGEDKWSEHCAAWFRPSEGKVFVTDLMAQYKYGERSLSYTKGLHTIKFTTQAMLVDNEPTGKYLLTLEFDGTEIYSGVNQYDVSTMTGDLFINSSKNYNYLYDINYNEEVYEEAEVINVYDLSPNTGMIRNVDKETAFAYTTELNTASRIFKFNVYLADLADNSELVIDIGSGESCRLWLQGGNNKNFFFGWTLDGHNTDRYYIYNKDNEIVGLEKELDIEFEMGRLRVAKGPNAGLDLVYLKVDGKYLRNESESTYKQSWFYVDPTAENGKPIAKNEIAIKAINYEITDAETIFKWTVMFGDTPYYFTDGSEITAPETTPTKAADADYHYTFDKWVDAQGNAFTAGTDALEDVTYTAVFAQEAHTFGEWQTTQDASCTTAGSKERTCTCGYVATAEILAAGHSLSHHDAVAPSCTQDGSVEYWECSVCHKMFSDAEGTTEVTNIVASATGHELTHHEAVAPKCDTAGNIEYWECSVCHKMFSDEAGTTEVTDVVLQATGEHHYGEDGICADCGAKDPDYKEETGSSCNLSLSMSLLASVLSLAAVFTYRRKR